MNIENDVYENSFNSVRIRINSSNIIIQLKFMKQFSNPFKLKAKNFYKQNEIITIYFHKMAPNKHPNISPR